MKNKKTQVLGIMSGSSLDGVDFGLFEIDTTSYPEISWETIKTHTYPYPRELKVSLSGLDNISAADYYEIENRYTDFIIDRAEDFLGKTFECKLIGIHGHTFLHNPSHGYSIQMGNAGKICEKLARPCVSDFRAQDIALGGEGAPMAPLVDNLLFSEYDACINLGGIVNITRHNNAYDIGPFNQVINAIAGKLGQEYDENGEIGRKGKTDSRLTGEMHRFPFYALNPPKSLSNQAISDFFPYLINMYRGRVEDLMHTFYAHIAEKITSETNKCRTCLITGGGAHNKYFIEVLNSISRYTEFFLPDNTLIDYKESLLIALAAQLRSEKKPSFIKGITAAEKPVSAGALYINATHGE